MSDSQFRIALVTGAAGGIGEAIADRFEQLGWDVLRSDLKVTTGPGAIQSDVRSEASWSTIHDKLIREKGRLDVLVNNAGILREAALLDTTLTMWQDVVTTNLTSTFLGCRAMLPLLKLGRSPAILNLGSIDALRGSLGHSAYAASKGGIVALTRALALELASDGIRVNALCPGTVDTPMAQEYFASAPGSYSNRIALHPLKRISTVQDQAGAAAFLCGADADFITGTALSVDGGRSIR